jgi:tRNA(Ile2) C34 agmatinyltransferase TiaS
MSQSTGSNLRRLTYHPRRRTVYAQSTLNLFSLKAACPLICKRCRSHMKELAHISHRKRKFRCRNCGAVRMQKWSRGRRSRAAEEKWHGLS